MKRILKWMGNTLTVISLLFILRAVYRLGFDFSGITNYPLFFLVILFSVCIKVLTVFISGCVWGNWVSFFARRRCNPMDVLSVYTKANIGKYLPGNVMQYVERNLFADRMNVGQAQVAVSSILEALSLVFVAFIIALLSSMDRLSLAVHSVSERLGPSFFPILLLLLAVLFSASFIVMFIFRKRILPVLQSYSLSAFLRCALINALGQGLVLFLLGALFSLLYVFMGGNPEPSLLFLIIGGYVVSWVLGFVMPGAPGGIGVREYVIQLLIAPLIGAEITLTISIIHRLITILGDFAAYLIGALFLPRLKETVL